MAKLIFVFALTLLALQGSEAFPKNPVLSSNIQDLISELNNLIKDTNTRFDELYTELKDKVVEIDDEANFNGLVDDFKMKVAELMTQDDAEACEPVAHEQIAQVQKLAAVFTCKFEINDELAALQIQLKVLTAKVADLLKEINNDVDLCLAQSHGNLIKFTKCIDEQLISVKQQLQLVEKEIQTTFDVLEQTMPLLADKISNCVANNKKTLMDKIKDAEEAIQICISRDFVAVPLKKSGFAHVTDYLKYLSEEVSTVVVTVPASVLSVQDKLNELVSRHNVEALVVEAKRAVEQELRHHTREVLLCSREARQLTAALAQDAQLGAEACQAGVQRVVDGLELRFAELADQARVLADRLSAGMLSCAKEHLLDVVGLARCLELVADEVHGDLVQLQKEQQKTTLYAVQAVDKAVLELDICLTTVDDKVKTDTSNILVGLNTCFNNVHLLF